MKKAILSIIVFSAISLSGQDRYGSLSTYVLHTPKYFFSGCANILTDETNQLILGTVSIGTLLAYQFDNKVKKFARGNGLMPELLADFGDYYGGGWAYTLLYPTILITSRIQGESRNIILRKMEFSFFVLSTTATITSLLKATVGRERPNQSDYRSFPSGHTSGSFAVAAIVDELYGPYAGSISYLMAGTVAMSRIHDNKHYLSDVIFGAGLGIVIGRAFTIQYHQEQSQNKFSLSINRIGGNGLLITFTLPFR